MAAWRNKISLLMLKNISLVRYTHWWNIVQHSKRNFISPRGHVISSLSQSSHVIFYLLYKHQSIPNLLIFAAKGASNGDIYTCEDNMLFSCVKISCFCGKAHLVFHCCLYNKNWSFLYVVISMSLCRYVA